MSWLYSQELVGVLSLQNSSDGKQSVQSSGTNMPEMYLSQGKTTEHLSLSQFGMMCKPLMDDHGEELLTSYLGGFPVKTLVQQEKEQVSQENALVCGNIWRESSMKYDRDTHGWKTHPYLLEEDLMLSSPILPKWGMIADGVLLEHTMLGLDIKEIGFGLSLNEKDCLHTPDTSKKRWGTPKCQDERAALSDRGKCNLGEQVHGSSDLSNGERLNPDWVEWLMGWNIGHTKLTPIVPKILSWEIDPADAEQIPRVTSEKLHRSERLKRIGNGQCPQAVVLAYTLLTPQQ